MPQKNPRVDAYIAAAPEFARPILAHLRKVVHAGCPDVIENIKWGMPSFERRGILCGMAAFKAHCVFGFWNGDLVTARKTRDDAMWQFGRITSLRDLPPERRLVAMVKKAAALDEQGVKPPARTKAPSRKKAKVPEDLAAALAKNRKARAGFEALTEAQRREYVEWIAEAKREETRARRVATTVEWAAEGKSMNWKYK